MRRLSVYLIESCFMAFLQNAHSRFILNTPVGLNSNISGNRINGYASVDQNNDGYPDVIMHVGAETGTASESDGKMFFNDGPSSFTFKDVTSSKIAGFSDRDDFGRQMLVVDFNNDDYYQVLRGFGGNRPINICYNNVLTNFAVGNGSQQPGVTIGLSDSGLPSGGGNRNSDGIVAVDWNQDGWLDINVDNNGGNDVFRNDQTGVITNPAQGTAVGQTGFFASQFA
ncbi:MAG: hypothetical protein GY751_24360 [Bacteroidetes bacterium]|nr:hypothetical protein [Bacteroidota bacterium]